MQIKIKCPNSQCGKTLIVDSEMAGKKGKCSTCEAVFLIPSAPGTAKPGSSTMNIAVTSTKSDPERKKSSASGTRKSPPKSRPRSGESKRSGEKYRDDYVEKPKRTKSRPSREELDDYAVEIDDDDYVDYEDYEADPPRRSSRPSRNRPQRSPGGRDDFYDDYDDYEDDYADPRPRGRRDRYEEDYYEDDPYEEDYYEDPYEDPYGPPRRGGRGGRRKSSGSKAGLIRAGFLVMGIAGCVLAGAMGIKMFLILLAMLSTSFGSGDMAALMVKIRELLWLGSSVAIIVGYSFLLFFPNKKGSLGLTIAALSVGSVNLLLRIFLLTVPLFSDKGFFGLGMMGLSTFGGNSRLEFFLKMGLIEGLFIAELVLIALALVAINSQLRDRYNMQHARRMIIPAGIYGGVLVVLGMFALILSETTVTSETAITIWKWVIYLVHATGDGMLVWYFISYILVMFNTKNAMPSK